MKTYIIDALNVIHISPNLRQLLNNSKENAVSALCSEISGYLKRYPSYKAMIIIDGAAGNLNKYNQNISLIESQNNTADNKIKEIIEKSQNKSSFIVVSNDTEVYNYAKMNVVTVMTSTDFIKIISEYSPNVPINSKGNSSGKRNKKEKPNSPTKKEMLEFKELFSHKDNLDIGY
ncbi:MAG: NYN domain-containing protein [Candidatus Kapabacteria bacterium]|nr:NYN domain-containing protein [Candidatus Kapabacteria bacterium]